MKVMFVRPNALANHGIPVGLAVLLSVLKKHGHTTKIFDTTFMTEEVITASQSKTEIGQFKPCDLSNFIKIHKTDIEKELIKSLSDFSPDLVAFSVMSNDMPFAEKLLNMLKQ